EISGHRDQPHLGMRARWRLLVGVFLIGGVALFDPLVLWLTAPVALTALLLVQVTVVKGAAKLELALAGMASGGIALLLSTAIVPFCMATGPIRLAGGRVTPFGGPFGPPLLGTATECRVQLRGPHISDETLQELAPGFAKLSGISRLDLLGARITTDGMRALLPSLNPSDLVLNGTKVDDDLFPLLAGKTRLRMLAVGWTGISDQGLEQLPSLTWNGWLSVSQTSVGDLGLAQIARQKYVHGLELAGTRVTDAGLAELSQMGELAYLDLDRTNVSDAGLAHLEGLKYLQHLRLKQTNVTDKGVEKLQKQPRKHALRIFR
ncbi:MAG: hypothetical protein ACKV0T_28650, partial [Planctomycetales bacterium]